MRKWEMRKWSTCACGTMGNVLAENRQAKAAWFHGFGILACKTIQLINFLSMTESSSGDGTVIELSISESVPEEESNYS